MSQQARHRALEANGLVHPRPGAVTAPLFVAGEPSFFAADKVQV